MIAAHASCGNDVADSCLELQIADVASRAGAYHEQVLAAHGCWRQPIRIRTVGFFDALRIHDHQHLWLIKLD